MVAAFMYDCEIPAPYLIFSQEICFNQHGLPIEIEKIFCLVTNLNTDFIIGSDSKCGSVLRKVPVLDCQTEECF